MKQMLASLLGARVTSWRTSVGSIATQAVSIPLNFLLQIVLVRILGADGYGHYAFAFAWVSLLVVGGSLGWNTAVVRLIPKYTVEKRPDLLRGLVRVTVLFSIVAGVVVGAVFFLSGFLTEQVGRGPGLYLAAGVLTVFSTLVLALSGIVRGFKRIVLSQFPNMVLRPLLLVALVYGWHVTGNRAVSPALALALHVVAATVAVGVLASVSWERMRTVEPGRPRYEMGAWWGYVLPMALITGINVGLVRSGVLVSGYLLDPVATGMYAACLQVARLTGFGLVILGAIVSPLLSESFSARDDDRLIRTLRWTARLSLVLSAPIFIATVAFGERILVFIAPEYAGGFPVLVLLALAQLFAVLAGPVGYLMVMTDQQKAAATILGGAMAANLGLLFLLVPDYGVLGAAIATAVTALGWNVAMSVVILRRMGWRCTAI